MDMLGLIGSDLCNSKLTYFSKNIHKLTLNNHKINLVYNLTIVFS